jgi:hypothetical protein
MWCKGGALHCSKGPISAPLHHLHHPPIGECRWCGANGPRPFPVELPIRLSQFRGAEGSYCPRHRHELVDSQQPAFQRPRSRPSPDQQRLPSSAFPCLPAGIGSPRQPRISDSRRPLCERHSLEHLAMHDVPSLANSSSFQCVIVRQTSFCRSTGNSGVTKTWVSSFGGAVRKGFRSRSLMNFNTLGRKEARARQRSAKPMTRRMEVPNAEDRASKDRCGCRGTPRSFRSADNRPNRSHTRLLSEKFGLFEFGAAFPRESWLARKIWAGLS